MSKNKYMKEVQNVVDVYRHSSDEWASSRERSLTCYEFVMNEQWTDEEKAEFLRTGRPPIVYNQILPRLFNLLGNEQLNRRSARIRPSKAEHNQLASVLQGLWTNVWAVNEADFELEKAILDGLIMLIPGWLRVDVEPNQIGQLDYVIQTVNPMSVLPDPGYRSHKLRDCGWILQENWLTAQEIQDIYGESDLVKNEPSYWEDLTSRIKGWFGGGDADSEFYDKDGHKFKVIEMQDRRSIRVEMFDTPSGIVMVDKADAEKFAQGRPEYRFVADTIRKQIHIMTVCPYLDKVLFDNDYQLRTDKYNLFPYHSFDFNNVKSRNNSLVNALLDPQRNLNKREIQKTNYIDHAINAPVLFSYEDKEAKDEFETNGNRPGMGLMFRNKNVKPSRLSPASLGNDVWNDIADSIRNMNDISGINDTARGQSEYSNESGKLFAMKAERAGATINPYYRNVSKLLKAVAEYFLETVGQVYGDSDRLAEISMGQEEQTVLLNPTVGNGFDIRQFDGRVVLDDGEHSVTKMQENMQMKLALANLLPPEYVNWEWILKDSELPDVKEQIDYIKMVTGQVAEANAMQTALEQEQIITDQVIAERSASQPAQGGNSGKNK